VLSLKLQGGPMDAAEISRFERSPHFKDAVRLRRWDDEAKIVGLTTPPLEHFVAHVSALATAD
jgi:predicted HD phosphohydrolase